jgi:Peptidase family M28
MAQHGWKQLLETNAWHRGRGKYPITAYSEFMPPPRLGRKPYGPVDSQMFHDDDPFGWYLSEFEQQFQLAAGTDQIARQLIAALSRLGRGEPAHGIGKKKLAGNPYWPEGILAPAAERYVFLSPLSISQTQDDKGRVRWTLFGASEQGPAKGFWRGFFTAPREQWPTERAHDFIRRLLVAAYGEDPANLADLGQAGFRVMEQTTPYDIAHWNVDRLPDWTKPLVWQPGGKLTGVKYLLTFEPFSTLPAAVRRAYLDGKLHLLPFPGSLLFWGSPSYLKLAEELPLAVQIALLHSVERHESPIGIRVPQSGWLHEPKLGQAPPDGSMAPVRNTFLRTNRWGRVHRYEDELKMTGEEDRVAHVLFSTAADDVGLYGKPMACNSQVWTHDFQLLLDGPKAPARDLAAAAEKVAEGGLFGYRFYYPPMHVGQHEVFWQRPLVAYLSAANDPTTLPDAPLGYFTAYQASKPRLDKAVELWPRLLAREAYHLAATGFRRDHDQRYHRTAINVRKLLDTAALLDHAPLPRDLARWILTLPKHETLEDWLASLAERAVSAEVGQRVEELLSQCLAPADPRTVAAKPARRVAKAPPTSPPKSLTFARTAKRSFEKAYWNLIASLATGQYTNKDNADCVRDAATQAKLAHSGRDLEALGDHLLDYYRRLLERTGMTDKVLVGEVPFRWTTVFPFPWMGGWVENQKERTYERDLLVVIPGRDRSRAIIMGDHYDTAYMEDVFGYAHGGKGPRLAAAGADDNHSATATLMLGAESFLKLSKAGKLEYDIWLVHLTGEEFPADCMGARHLCQKVVEETLAVRTIDGHSHDLSKTRVGGVYVLDMVAHNNDRDRDVFQMCPGTNRESMWLAWQAHQAAETWNASVPAWNATAERKGLGRGKRSPDGELPDIAAHLKLDGEVRPPLDPRSTLYNTDGQIFSDAGVPVVLFMENYDINRKGYHDTHDTLENIDLDYGSAVAAIAIESVARAATQKAP